MGDERVQREATLVADRVMVRQVSEWCRAHGKRPLMLQWLDARRRFRIASCAYMGMMYGAEIGYALLRAECRAALRKYRRLLRST